MNLVRATLRSDNTVYAQLDLDLGPKSVAETAKAMGITTKLDGYPAEGLGGLTRGVSPLEMANAYATLASGGIRNKPIAIVKVRFPDGDVEDLGKPKRERVLSDGGRLRGDEDPQENVQQGTGTRANIGCPAAGKTGTTDNFNDAWFVGYTPHLTAAVWVGYPDALREMRSVHGISVAGGTFPAEIWAQVHERRKGPVLRRFPATQELDPVDALLRQVQQPGTQLFLQLRLWRPGAERIRGLHADSQPGSRARANPDPDPDAGQRERKRQRRRSQ